MKKLNLFLMGLLFSGSFLLISCNNAPKEEGTGKGDGKITDIPATTASKEALSAFRQGLAAMELGDAKIARTFFNKAIEADSKFGLAYLMRANTSNSAKDYSDDISRGKSNIDSASSWEKTYAEFMATNLTGERNKGMELLQKIAAEYPDAARAQVDLGNAYAGNNQDDKSREAYSKAIQLNPSWPGGYAALTNSYLFNEPKDLKKAEENALKIVGLAPKSAGAEITLGDVYRAQNDFQKAKDAYTKAVQLNPDGPEAYYKLGHSNTYLGNLEEARINYTDGGQHDEARTGAILNTSYTYLYAGDTKAAVKYLMDQIAATGSWAPKEKVANYQNNLAATIGTIAMHTKDAATLKEIVPVIRATSKQVTIDLGNTSEAKVFEVADSLHWQAMISLAEGKFDDAKTKLEAMKTALDPIKDDRKLEGYHADMGMICMDQKNYSEAITHLAKADKNSVYNKYLLAKANEAAGNKDKAMSWYKEVAAYNFNEVGNALVRGEAKKKIAAQ